ncbi:FecR family protein [Ensifer adhaerens]|uniref:FecR family protein n=1 Tax=Ensifer adhaerens TaxID=106592 RepID=UPI000CF02503|nr:FecR domain-containing protein [Ensifer adhaerens]
MTTRKHQDGQDEWADEASQSLDPVQRDAIKWFTVISDGQAAPETLAAHERWMQASPDHAACYAEIEALWTSAAGLEAGRQKKKGSRSPTRRQLMHLAVLAFASSAGYGAYRSSIGNQLQTARGERRTVVLDDGTRVEMSGGTSLSVHFTMAERKVTLDRGEAYFTVAKDAQRPFAVDANGGRVVALGTAFNLSILSDQLEIVVSESAVMVDYGGRSLRLDEGQQLTCRAGEMGTARPSDVETDLAWRSGRLVFLGRPFGEVIDVLNRWTPQRLILMDDRLSRLHVTLVARIDEIDVVLPQLARVLPISTRHIPLWGTLIYRADRIV